MSLHPCLFAHVSLPMSLSLAVGTVAVVVLYRPIEALSLYLSLCPVSFTLSLCPISLVSLSALSLYPCLSLSL